MFIIRASKTSALKHPQPIFNTGITFKNSLAYSSKRKMSTPAATIKSLDHLVLTVASVPQSTEWYVKNLGMRSESFVSAATPDITRYSLIFGSQKINLHELRKVCKSSMLDSCPSVFRGKGRWAWKISCWIGILIWK